MPSRLGTSFPATPLYRSVMTGNVAMAQFLVEQGANIEALLYHEQSVLSVAARNGDYAMVRLLVELGADKEVVARGGWTPFLCAFFYEHWAVVEYLLDQGCVVNHRDGTGWTALHYAAMLGDLEHAQLLFRFGAQLDLRDVDGNTPADLAVQEGHPVFADAATAEEIRRRDHGFKRDRSTIPGTEEHAASRRTQEEREAEVAAAAAADAAADDSDDDDDDDEDDDEEAEG
jgi:ankyrin repeat protein